MSNLPFEIYMVAAGAGGLFCLMVLPIYIGYRVLR